MDKYLKIRDMHRRHRGLSKAVADSYQEAAVVCLSRHHKSPVSVDLTDNANQTSCAIQWRKPDRRTIDAWANETVTTEAGAYAVSSLPLSISGMFLRYVAPRRERDLITTSA